MTLTYTKTTISEEKQTYTLKVPDNWAMYTAQGNSRMKAKAVSFIDKLEKANTYADKIKAFQQYFKAYVKACRSKSEVMQESMDTEVRESVFDFARKAALAVDIDYSTLDKLWNDRYKGI